MVEKDSKADVEELDDGPMTELDRSLVVEIESSGT